MKAFLRYLRKRGVWKNEWRCRVSQMVWRDMEPLLQGKDDNFLGIHCDGEDVHAFFLIDDKPLGVTLALDDNRFPSLGQVLPVASYYERMIYDLYGVETLWGQDEDPIIDRGQWTHSQPLSKTPFTHKSAHHSRWTTTDTSQAGDGRDFSYFGNTLSTSVLLRASLHGRRLSSPKLEHGFVHRGLSVRCRGVRIKDAWSLCGRYVAGQSVTHQLAFSRAIEASCSVSVNPDIALLRRVFIALETVLSRLYSLMIMARLLGVQSLVSACMIFREKLLAISQEIVPSRLLMDVCTPGGVNVENLSSVAALLLDLSGVGHAGEKFFRQSWKNYPGLYERLSSVGALEDGKIVELGTTGPLRRIVEQHGRMPTKRHINLCADRQELLLLSDIFANLCFIEEAASTLSAAAQTSATVSYTPVDEDGLGWADGPWGRVSYWVRLESGRVQTCFCSRPEVISMKLCQEALEGEKVEDIELILASFGANAHGFDG